MKNKVTLVKVVSNDYRVSDDDLKKWKKIFEDNDKLRIDAAVLNKEIEVNEVDLELDENYVTLVKIGDESWKPTPTELEYFAKIFEDNKNDKDFVIFSCYPVTIESLNFGKIIAVET